MNKGFIIAIDGPLASGKGTIAKKLAKELQGIDLYTGAMYRCVALFCINEGIVLDNAADVIAQLPKITIAYKDNRIFLNDIDITEAIQDSAIAEGSSVVAAIPDVRKDLVERQQKLGKEEMENGTIVVVEGRDIGTVVFPNAALKLYLTASEKVRAQRRLEQYQKRDSSRSFEEVLEEVKIRDTRDTHREVDPLTSDPEKLGYYVLDNSDLSQEETVEAIITELQKRELL